jgi:hypothetical protein
MRTFEERYTAWLEGRLSRDESERFEKELDGRAPGQEEPRETAKLGKLLRIAGAPVLRNADFFSHQLIARIELDRRASQPARKSGVFFTAPWLRFAISGLAALVIGWFLGSTWNPDRTGVAALSAGKAGFHLASVIAARPSDPTISATVVQDEQDEMTVLWLDGLDYLPASYELQ